MYYKTGINLSNEKEFLASEKVQAFTCTVVPDGITADSQGRKIAHKGSLISADGEVVTVSVVEGEVTFSDTPVGILLEAQDVTNGAQPGAFMVEGYVIGERLDIGEEEYSADIGAAIHEALPEIKFV